MMYQSPAAAAAEDVAGALSLSYSWVTQEEQSLNIEVGGVWGDAHFQQF